MTLLTVDSLSVSYRAGWVLRDLSLSVGSGEVVGLVGESGCGKTTLGWSILGLLPDFAEVRGRIEFDGQDVTALPQGERRKLLGERMSVVPQAAMSSLDPMFRIGDQLTEVIRAHKGVSRREARDAAVHWLGQVGVPAPEKRMRSYPHELSGGTRQRVAIAAALSLEPRLLIADEPTSALDVTIQSQILTLLKSLIQQHAGAVLLITHDLGVVAQLCDRVAVMYAGEIVEEAPVRTLLAAPKHPYTAKLLASHPSTEDGGGRLATIPGEVMDPRHYRGGCPFRPRCDKARAACEGTIPWAPVGESSVRCVMYGADVANS